MLWFWLNVPLAAVFIGAWCGIPLWKVLKQPNWGSQPMAGRSLNAAEPVLALAGSEHGASGDARRTQ